uniref:hypothetical protein n=1 Tax=Thaumasiovibrio occultus TaxID=1891184 RepID=UPI000B353623|nr:hypothetical protein [Thaumasiovibrio occultus]
MKVKTCSYRAIIKASGIYDALMMLPFAIPGLSALVLQYLAYLHQQLGLAGAIPVFTPFHLLFVNIMASISIVWAVIRIRNPTALYAWYDTAARLLIAAIMLVYLLRDGISGIIWLFFATEVIWAALQINGYFFKNDHAMQSAHAKARA